MWPNPQRPLQPFSGCALCSSRSSLTGCQIGLALPCVKTLSQPCCSLVLKYPPSDVCFLLTVRFSVNALREVAMSHQCIGCHVAFACVALTVVWCPRIGVFLSLPSLVYFYPVPLETELRAYLFNCCALGTYNSDRQVQAFNLLYTWL